MIRYKMRFKKSLFAVCLSFFVMLGYVCIQKLPIFFPVKLVSVDGHVFEQTRLEVEAVALPYIERGLFGFKIVNLQKALNQLPWVKESAIKRIFPDRLFIRIQQKQPVARWGQHGLIDSTGQLFFVNQLSASLKQLPLFLGNRDHIPTIYRFYQQLSPRFSHLSLKMKTLHLDSDGSWYIMLRDGVGIRLGRDAIEERLNRLFLAYPKLSQVKGRKIHYIDLRYTNGIVVG